MENTFTVGEKYINNSRNFNFRFYGLFCVLT